MTDTLTNPAPAPAHHAATPAKRGFATMSPESRRAIASMGGSAAHLSGVAHCFDSETARAASLKRKNIRRPVADPHEVQLSETVGNA